MKITIFFLLSIAVISANLNSCKSPGNSGKSTQKDEISDVKTKDTVMVKKNIALEIFEGESLSGDILKKLQVNDSILVVDSKSNEYKAVVERFNIDINETITVRASIKEPASGHILLSSSNNILAGSITIPGSVKLTIKTDKETGILSFSETGSEHGIIERDSVLIPPPLPGD